MNEIAEEIQNLSDELGGALADDDYGEASSVIRRIRSKLLDLEGELTEVPKSTDISEDEEG